MTLDQLLKGLSLRILALCLIVVGCAGLLLFKLWFEQVRLGQEHRDRIRKQSIRIIRVAAVRGRIFTADGKLLTDNRPSFDVYFHVHEMRRTGDRKHTAMENTASHVLEESRREAANAIDGAIPPKR